MTFNIDIKDQNLAGNPIVLKIDADNEIAVNYVVLDVDENELYVGTVVVFASVVEIDIDFLFGHLKNKAGVETYRIRVVDIDSNLAPREKIFCVFSGGISRNFIRFLHKNNSDIFKWKLKNQSRNFLLTTRSNSQVLFVPENELLPIGCYPTGMRFDILAQGNVVDSFDFARMPMEIYHSIDFSDLRKRYFENSGRLCSEFIILSMPNLTISTRIVITEAKPTVFFLKFRNSFGEFEKIALYGVAEYRPTFEEKEDIQAMDKAINDFARKQQRKKITHTYQAESGYRQESDRLFMLDALLSDEVYFVVKNQEYAAKISTETELIDTTDGQPINVKFIVELLDTESNFSPLDYEHKALIRSLVDNNGNILTDNAGNILTSN